MVEKYYYDFHIHSCLSPCADEDMTPNNIAGMAVIKGLNILALTDHNSCKNCPAFFAACKKYGIVPIAGAEITCLEDVHMICLFPTLEDAMAFDEQLDEYRIFFENDEEIFGTQLVVDEEDNVISREKNLLVNATMLDIESLYHFAKRFGAVVYPAHIDREANGIISVLGMLPETPRFSCLEFHKSEKIEDYKNRFSDINNKPLLVSSDAHYLWDINEAENYLEISLDEYSSTNLRNAVFDILSGDK